ncbi:MAG: InlB B-repeat-containing protein [Lachnospiraceae bacterium]|nr:InlB B-repeat-containing protein [Lachnospiraceae bacterium]
MRRWSLSPLESLLHVIKVFSAGIGLLVGILLLAFGLTGVKSFASEESIFFSNPHLSISPDGTGFTFSKGVGGFEKHDYAYMGYKRYINGITGPRPLSEGEHYYHGLIKGMIPIGYWELKHPMAECIHGAYITDISVYGLHKWGVTRNICHGYYNPGWIAHCAVCGEGIPLLIYLSESVASTISFLPSATSCSNYFYLCPYSNCIEQGAPIMHSCTGVSANRYLVNYNPNGATAGSMPGEYFYAGGATVYEGDAVTSPTALRGIGYTRDGYIFKGWSTSPQGGVVFSDKESWAKVSSVLGTGKMANGSSVNLYAVWEVAFDMTAKVERNLKATDGKDIFARGESGYVSIVTKGYAEKIEVIFPEQLSAYNLTIDCKDNLKKNRTDKAPFVIPIYGLPDGEWRFGITVKAYKQDKCIEKLLSVTVSGDEYGILNEICTGLR